MTWRQHRDMLMQSVKWVLGSIILGILAIVMVLLMILANAGYAQHRVDVNMAKSEMAEQLLIELEN